MKRARYFGVLLAASTGCVAPREAPPPGACPVADAGNWRAWTDEMPGATRTLNVTGIVTVPTGGWRVWLERGEVLESDPQIQRMILRAEPPPGGATQAIVTHQVQASFPASGRYGAVTIGCGGETIAEISPVESAF